MSGARGALLSLPHKTACMAGGRVGARKFGWGPPAPPIRGAGRDDGLGDAGDHAFGTLSLILCSATLLWEGSGELTIL